MPRLTRLLLLGALLPTILALATVAQAHDSPEHSIEELTEHIQHEGESVPLLLRRASQYRVLGETEKAIADLTRVLQLEPNQPGALVELARILLSIGKPDVALTWIQQAITAAGKNESENAHLYATRGDIYAAQKEYANAFADYNRAIAGDAAQLDCYLNRSWILEKLGRSDERIKGLAKGYEATSSIVLQNEWIEALIDGGQAQAALRFIEPQLQQARLKSSWLIRRARARLALGSQPAATAAAQTDLKTAIAEINVRLRPSRPDTDLLLDRALSVLLRGNVESARQVVVLAEAYEANPRRLEHLQQRLANLEANTAKSTE
jgi:tetratricopeptide (TPR) repeat protein